MDFQEIVDNAYYSSIDKREQNRYAKEAFSKGFQRGAQWSARTSSSLAPHIAQFCEFMVWLTAYDSLNDATNYAENTDFTKT